MRVWNLFSRRENLMTLLHFGKNSGSTSWIHILNKYYLKNGDYLISITLVNDIPCLH